jgi:hypothetical protein
LLEFNYWDNNAGCASSFTIERNVATLNLDEGLWAHRLEGGSYCSSFTVLMSANRYEVGFANAKFSITFTSRLTLKFRTRKADGYTKAVVYESPPLNIPACSRDDIFLVRKVGSLLEFERNDQLLNVNFEVHLKEAVKKDAGVKFTAKDSLAPVVFLLEQSDFVTMLEYEES